MFSIPPELSMLAKTVGLMNNQFNGLNDWMQDRRQSTRYALASHVEPSLEATEVEVGCRQKQ